ncbi:MAG: Kelch repeat-containing protein [Polyangiales bacterium]
MLRAHAAFAGRAGVGGSLTRVGDGHRLAATSGFRSGAIDAVLPARADQPLKIAVPGREGAWVTLVAEGTRSVEPRIADRAVVHEDALPATDLVHVADASRVEELRVMRSASAPRTATWKIARGPDIAALRVNGDRVEALDAASRVVMSTEPIVAIDAHEVVRTPKLRVDGDRLVVDLDTEGLAYPIVLDPSWITSLSTMLAGRTSPFTWKLADGRFLVLGGVNSFAVDVYDPVTDSWAPDTASQHLVAAHDYGSTVTPLPTGKLLLVGGGSVAELYDPALLKTTTTGSPTVANRIRGTATLLPAANKVVFAGGEAGGNYSNVEVYDIGTGVFTAVPSLPAPRTEHVAALLTTGPNAGKILLAGGRDAPYLSTAELLDPSTWTSTPTPNKLSDARVYPSITLLTKGPNSGKYLIAGGYGAAGPGAVSTTDLYDPATNTFAPGPTMTAAHAQHAAVTLSDGRVLIASGNGPAFNTPTSVVEVFDPTAGTWTALANVTKGRIYASAFEISGGRYVVIGGNDIHSEVYWPDPIACSSGASCTSGNCVDGYCCDTACTGQCSACDVAGRKGICSPVTGDAPHGTRTACSPFVLCASGACASSCASDAACAADAYCDVGPKTCVTKKPTGSGCTAANQCVTGNCVDGYCCTTSCAGTCSACDVAGSLGTCTAVLGTPHGARSCPSPYGCSASGSCASGSCAVDTDCASGLFCNASSACVTRLSNGVACKADSNCTSGNCVDGVCCDSKCTGSCQSCDVVGKLGTCSSVDSGAPHGTRSCAPYLACKLGACATSCASTADCASGYCSASKCVGGKALGQPCGLGSECTSGQCADGVCCNTACTEDCGSCSIAGLEGTCSPKPAAATCGASGCTGAHLVTVGHCSGTTTSCVYGATTPCPGALVCADATTCKTSCAKDADCTTGACDTSSGTCTLPDGGVAETGVPDASGPDAIAGEPAPRVDDHPTVAGFTRCSKASDCGSGFCVDGVCCDTACEGKCHSCALLTSPGKCTLSPIGVDLRSDCGPALSCLGTCDGKGQCIGAGAGTMCGRNRCVSPSTGVGPAYCAAAGAKCPTDGVVPFDCAPYICEPAFGACRSDCATSADCANGSICDVGSRTCIAAPPPEDAGGGCSFGAPSRGNGFAILAALLVAARLRARGRARRGSMDA